MVQSQYLTCNLLR